MSKKSASRISAHLIKSVSILAVGASLASCASDTVRFNDGFYTGAVPKQSVGAVQTPYPQAAQQQTYQGQSQGYVAPQGVDNTYTASVNQQGQRIRSRVHAQTPQVARPLFGQRQPVYTQPQSAHTQPVDTTYTGSIKPQATVQRQTLSAPQPLPVKAEPQTAAKPAPTVTTPSAPSQVANATPRKEGWTAAGGTYVTMRQGETVYNLAKRYGVPANAIMEANNLSDPKGVAAGTQVIIPTYVYSRTAPISTPDNNIAVRSASSNIGGRSEFPMSIAPVPDKRPQGVQVASIAPSMAQVASPVSSSGTYVVSAGDTLSSIAQRAGTNVTALKNLNGLSGDNIRLGQKLMIPGVGGNAASVQKVSAPKDVPAVQPKAADKAISTIDSSSTAKAPANTGVEALRWPVRGRVVSSYGSNVGGKGNDGIDISVPRGSAVKAAENGVVIYAGDGLKEFGKTVLVRHGNGLVTVYGHLDSISVERGANVSRGQNVGSSGMTGSAKQPQLHFEVRKNTTPVNPMTYLR
ncbi:peptidoglycan DD-metalloendopeptidase family protein [Ahrensia kielensis]|uniref:Peptidoglycan DD-metalloendopeptidase family protein n=1 Tax=Ahrensia kielensis TaxID=76980 RepID=A0ABU9T5K7_9HYPH